jgi:hypothetical protein
MTSMFGQEYMQTVPSFSMSNFSLTSYTPRGNERTYTNASGNYQTSYSTVAYTDLVPLLGSSLDILPNHVYHNATRFNVYGQLEADDFGYETRHNFLLGRSQLI